MPSDEKSASIFCFTPLRIPVHEIGKHPAPPLPHQPFPATTLLPCSAPPLPTEPCSVCPHFAQQFEPFRLASYWKSQHARAKQRIEELEQEVARLQAENRTLKDQAFGRKSEKQSRQDRSNDLDDPHHPKTKRSRGQQRGKAGPKRRDYAQLSCQEQWLDLPADQCACPRCGAPLVDKGNSEDSQVIEIEVKAYRRKLRRRRYRRTCQCPDTPLTVTAPPAPKPLAKGLYGVSVWVEILLGKYANHQPTERLLSYLGTCGLGLSAGTVAGGMQKLEPMFTLLAEAIGKRNQQATYVQADETRWRVFGVGVEREGRWWWLWIFVGPDTVFYVLDARRSHDVPEKHYVAKTTRILMVDRYSAYKAMQQVKDGLIVLAFCWAHVRRDFVRVGKGWPELKEWALSWLRSIHALYGWQRQRLQERDNPGAFQKADTALQGAIVEMQKRTTEELADAKLRLPCRKTLASLQEHWTGLTRFVEDLRIPMDNNDRKGGRVARRWGGKTTTVQGRNGVVGWRRCCFRYWRRCRCGS